MRSADSFVARFSRSDGGMTSASPRLHGTSGSYLPAIYALFTVMSTAGLSSWLGLCGSFTATITYASFIRVLTSFSALFSCSGMGLLLSLSSQLSFEPCLEIKLITPDNLVRLRS